MENCIHVCNVSHAYHKGFFLLTSKALQDLTLEIPKNTIFGFLGANGSGKTTLINLITGLRKPTQGSIKIFGYPAHSLAARSKIGYLPERPYFHDHLSATDLLKYFGALAGLKKKTIQERIPYLLEEVGLSHAKNAELKTFSKGMLQRIGIAQAMIHNPDLLVLDEPMSGLDPIGRKDIRDIILKIAQQGRSVFFSSHVIPDVESISHQVGILHKGKLMECGPIGQFLKKGKLSTEIAFYHKEKSVTKPFKEVFPIEEGFRALFHSQEDVQKALAYLLEKKAVILWVTPLRISLEEYFQTLNTDPKKKAS